MLPPLFAAEGRGKEGMKVTESLVNPLKRVQPFTTLRKYLSRCNTSRLLKNSRRNCPEKGVTEIK